MSMKRSKSCPRLPSTYEKRESRPFNFISDTDDDSITLGVRFFTEMRDKCRDLGTLFDLSLVLSGLRQACLYSLDSEIFSVLCRYRLLSRIQTRVICCDNRFLFINRQVYEHFFLEGKMYEVFDTLRGKSPRGKRVDQKMLGKILGYQRPTEYDPFTQPSLNHYILKFYITKDEHQLFLFHTEAFSKRIDIDIEKVDSYRHCCECLANPLGLKIVYRIKRHIGRRTLYRHLTKGCETINIVKLYSFYANLYPQKIRKRILQVSDHEIVKRMIPHFRERVKLLILPRKGLKSSYIDSLYRTCDNMERLLREGN